VQEDKVKSRRQQAADCMTKFFDATSGMPVKSTRLIGSAARNTIVRPLNDIDVLTEFQNMS
jgi:predicted nucleotidyltransferase